MNVPNATQCPAESVLNDFGLGKLDAANAETISRHIETCADCRQRVAGLSGDSFVGRLRQAGSVKPAAKRERTYVPGESLANAANSTDGSPAREDGLPRPSRSEDGRTRERVPGPSHIQDGLGGPSSAPPELTNHPDYELIKELGQGGMGTVYLAKNRLMDRLEVLKVISQAVLNKSGARERFLREIQSAASLHHANIVAAYSVFRLGDSLVFAMEYVKGQDLEKVVATRGYLPVANAAFYIHQVANGLQHAHEKELVHRDIKPNNLMLAIEGKKHAVKILDFGLAKATSEKGADAGLTKSGQMLGTPLYVAPEQTLDAHQADIRADIYSLGCTLYYFLAGRPPFQESSLYALLDAHQRREAQPLNLVRHDVPVELAAVVGKMLAKDPAKRYQTPIEVAKALAPFFKPVQSVAPPAPQKSRDEGEYPHYTPDMIQQPPGATPLPAADQPVSLTPIPIAPATPVTVATAQPEEFSVTIDTHRGAPKRRGGWSSLPPWQRWAATGGAAALLLLSVVFLLQTKDGAIRIEINDPQIEVAVKGTDIVLKQADNGHDVKLSPGEKTLVVERGDFKFETDKLILKKADTATVAVTLLPGRIEVKEGNRVIGAAILPPDPSKRFPCEIGDTRSARWSIEGGDLVQGSLAGEEFIIFGDAAWQDVNFAVDVKRTEGNGVCGLWFRYQNPQNLDAYALAVQGNKSHEAVSKDKGMGARLATSKGSLLSDKWYRVEVRLRGSHGECYLDGAKIIEFDSRRPAGGRFGLATNWSAYRFRNIVIKSPAGKILLEGLPDLENARGQSGILGQVAGKPSPSSDGLSAPTAASLNSDRPDSVNTGAQARKSDVSSKSAPGAAAIQKGDSSKRFPFEVVGARPGRWSIDGDELMQSSLEPAAKIVFGNPNWEEFDFSVDAKSTDGNNVFGLMTRHQDERNYDTYSVGVDWNKSHKATSVREGKITTVAQSKGSVTAQRWYQLKIQVRRARIQIFLDNDEIMSFDGGQAIRGRVGLVTFGSAVRFRNLLVNSPDGDVLLQGMPDLAAEPPPKPYEQEKMNVLAARGGTLPIAVDGRPLNFDFETGNLQDWTAEGDAFTSQPVKGDILHERYKYLRSQHAGQFWIGGDEVRRDTAKGTLTSVPFKVTHPYASFLMSGGGIWSNAAVQLVRRDDNQVFFGAVGHGSDTLHPVAVDVREQMGREIFIRVVDGSDRYWGRVNFDDFRFHDTKPDIVPSYASLPRLRPGVTVDMLKLLDIDRDNCGACIGLWHWDEQHRLVGEGWRLIQLPILVPNEYDLALTVEGNPRAADVWITLPVGFRRPTATLDGWDKTKSGLSNIDGKDPSVGNSSTHLGAVLLDDQPNKLVCEVRSRSIRILCNGTVIIDWRGDPTSLSYRWGNQEVAGWDGLLVGGPGTAYRISKLELTPLSETEKVSQPRSTSSASIADVAADRRAAEYVLSVGGKIKINGELNGQGWQGAKEITKSSDLPDGQFRLTFVDLNVSRGVTEAGMTALQGTKHLQEICIDACPGISDASLANFKDNRQLKSLHLYRTRISAAGLRHFKDCSELTWLYLGLWSEFGDEDMAFFKEFSGLSSLGMLWLHGTAVGDAGLANLKGANNLGQLNLNGTKITDEGLRALAKHQKLTWLHLHDNSAIGDSGLAWLRECRGLRGLNLKNTKVTAEGVRSLKRALPNCKITWDGGTE